MAEFDMALIEAELLLLNYIPTERKINIFNDVPILPARVQKTYTEKMVVPFFYKLENEDGTQLEFKREVREWDVVLPFGSDNTTPRRTPTEINYKGRNLKNSFM